MKTCKTCGESKPLSMFYKREDGTYRPNCRPCTCARDVQRYLARKEQGQTRSRNVGRVEPMWAIPTQTVTEGLDCVRLRKWRGPVNVGNLRASL